MSTLFNHEFMCTASKFAHYNSVFWIKYIQIFFKTKDSLKYTIFLQSIRPRFYTVPNMKTLFITVSVDRIVSFVKEVNLFDKI